MGLEGKRRTEMPEAVKRARYHEDHAALSAMGKKGAEQATLNRVVSKALHEEEVATITAAQAKLYQLSPEGDVLPPE